MKYPVTLDLRDRTCVIVGGGGVAARKVTGLQHTGATIVVIAPTLNAVLKDALEDDSLIWIRRRWAPGCLQEHAPSLVFAATNDADVNQSIAAEARQLGALVNLADDGMAGDFSNMALLRRPPLLVALDSGGASPALVRWLRDRIAGCVGEEHATLARWLGEIRPRIRADIPEQEQRQNFYDAVLESDVLALLGSDQVEEARSLLHSLVRKSG